MLRSLGSYLDVGHRIGVNGVTTQCFEGHNVQSACPVVLGSTHERALDIVPLEALRRHAVDPDTVADIQV